MPHLPSFLSRTLLVMVTALVFSGCVAAAIGAATVVAVDIGHDRRSVGSYVDDNSIELKIRKDVLANDELRQTANVSVTSMNGIVLLTGQTPTEALRGEVLKITRSVPEVRQIVNELQIAGKSGLGSRTNDSLLTAKVKTRLFTDLKLDADRIKVVTEDRTVYLMGLVTEDEATAAVDSARTSKGVRKVVKVFEYIAT